MIIANDVCLSLEGRIILDHVSFNVTHGESVALVGPNGSGKTSILRTLLGLVPFDGRISVGGRDVVREPVESRTLMSYVPQKAAFGDATAIEVVAFVAKLRRLERACIDSALDAVGLAGCAEQRVRTFSVGMQQRLSLGVAILVDAPVLLLDEPTASLDRDGQQAFLGIVAALRKRGRTLLLASHRPEEVESLTDRVLHLDRGRVIAPTAMRERGARVIPFGALGERR